MNKYILYTVTTVIHLIIYTVWWYFTRQIGLLIVVGHWSLFGGQCCLSHIERWIHVKYVGESWKVDNWRTCIAYRLFKHIHPIFR